MSETTTTTTTPPIDAGAASQQVANNSLWAQQFIVAVMTMLIVAGCIMGVFLKADPPTLQLVIGIIIGSYGKDVIGFYFGSSKSSQDKDTNNAKLQERSVVPAPAVVPAIVPATTVVTTERNQQ